MPALHREPCSSKSATGPCSLLLSSLQCALPSLPARRRVHLLAPVAMPVNCQNWCSKCRG